MSNGGIYTLTAAALAASLLDLTPNYVARARLLATSAKESGARLLAIPVTAFGLRVDDHTLRVAVGLTLGTTIVSPHQCQHCGEEVDCPRYSWFQLSAPYD